MLRFEIKKVFSKFKNRMAVVLLLIILVIVSMLTMNRVGYVDENGNQTSGILAAKSLRAEKNKWKGYITEDVLAAVVGENSAISCFWFWGQMEQIARYSLICGGVSTILHFSRHIFSLWQADM